MTTKHFLLFAVMLFAGIVATDAQKYGHLNFGNLISSLPETKAADEELATYQKQLNADVESKTKAWQTKAQAFFQEVEGGNLAPVKQQERQQALEKERDQILQSQQSISQKVQMKRKELLGPIIDEVEAAIKEVAEEKGYVMIFDTSVFNAILFAEESEDVMELVKAKL